MPKPLNITVFVFTLLFLLSLVPPVNQLLKSDVLSNSFYTVITTPKTEYVDPPPGFPEDDLYIKIVSTGQIVAYSTLISFPAHDPACPFPHLHPEDGFGYDIYGEIYQDPEPNGCGLGPDLKAMDPEATSTTTTSTEEELVSTTTSVADTMGEEEAFLENCPETVYIPQECTPETITVSETATCPPPEEIVCPEPEPAKKFDYGAFLSQEPLWNLPWDTDEAPHFLSDDRFPSLRIGPTVDAPEYLANDTAASDQDGLDFVLSSASKVVLNQIHNERGKYGTIVVGKWEKLESSYEFSVLSAIQVSAEEFKTPSIFQADGVHIPFDGGTVQMKEGWLTILYFDAEGANTAGKPDFGFTLDQIKGTTTLPGWDGTNPSLDQIIYGGIREAFDVSRVPGEVEDYLYCDRGPTGFRYYKPNDPQYALDCGEEPAVIPEEDQVICDFSNIKTFVCDTVQQTTSDPQDSDPNVTTTQDTRPVMTIIEERVSQYAADPDKNSSEARLRVIHDYLGTFLPNL